MNQLLYQIAEIELVYRHKIKPTDRPQITCSNDAYEIFKHQWDKNKIEFIEQAKLMLLNRNNRVLGLVDLSSGGVAGTVVDPKIAFAAALKANASSILLAHNHPSGNTQPSSQDKILTQNLIDVGRKLTLPLRDHLIITPEGYFSFADELGL